MLQGADPALPGELVLAQALGPSVINEQESERSLLQHSRRLAFG